MTSNFVRFFSGNKKKKEDKQKVGKTKSTETTASSAQSDSEEDSYEDPANAFPTDAPVSGKPGMPNYPPPRLNTGNSVVNKKRDDYIEPYDSRHSGPSSPCVQQPSDSQNNYADPFDSKLLSHSESKDDTNKGGDNDEEEEDEYEVPYEPTKIYRKDDDADNYSAPWDCKPSVPPPPPPNDDSDNYSAPWDMAKSLNQKKTGLSINKNIAVNNTHDAYSDPWDSKSSSSPMSTGDGFDDTYSEPYDKGKVTVTQRRGDRHVEDEMAEFTDKEKRIFGINASKDSVSDPSKTQGAKCVENAGDYDQPWEWNTRPEGGLGKDVKSMSISEAPGSPTSPSMEMNASPAPQPSYKEVRDNSEDPSSSSSAIHVPSRDSLCDDRDYEVDPTIPLQNQGWFHGRIRRLEAEKLLENDPDCSYLIRNSESSKIDYSLSLRNNGATIHLRISCKDGKYILGVNSRPFDTIPEMIHHYSMNKLNIRGAEQAKLKFPVLQEAVYFTVMPGS